MILVTAGTDDAHHRFTTLLGNTEILAITPLSSQLNHVGRFFTLPLLIEFINFSTLDYFYVI